MRVLITRPEQDALALTAALATRGVTAVMEPLLTIIFEPIDELDVSGAQALIATSKNGVRSLALSEAMGAARELPLFAVGPGTAAMAAACGFAHVIKGPKAAKDLGKVIASIAEVNSGPLVHLAGEQLAYDIGADLRALGFHVLQPLAYRTQPLQRMSAKTIAAIASGALHGVILLSPETARIYARLILQHGLTTANRRLTHFCLSAKVAKALESLGPVSVAVATLPNLEELLALIDAAAAKSTRASDSAARKPD